MTSEESPRPAQYSDDQPASIPGPADPGITYPSPPPGPPPQFTGLPQRRYGAKRVACGIWWAFITLLCAISLISSLAGGAIGSAFGALAVGALAGWYDWRIWTLRAKWLMFLIIF